jgi:hypothetical protein
LLKGFAAHSLKEYSRQIYPCIPDSNDDEESDEVEYLDNVVRDYIADKKDEEENKKEEGGKEEDKKEIEKKDFDVTIYRSIHTDLRMIIQNILFSTTLESELPGDSLIVLYSKIITLLIEYNNSTSWQSIETFDNDFCTKLFTYCNGIILNRGEGLSERRLQLLQFIRIQIIKFLNSFLDNSQFKEKVNILNKIIVPNRLFQEVIFYTTELVEEFRGVGLISKHLTWKDVALAKRLEYLYVFDYDFEDHIDLEFCLVAVKYIRTVYSICDMKSLENLYKEQTDVLNSDQVDQTSCYSFTGMKIYQFYERLVISVEILDYYYSKNPICFFTKPPITFLLSEESKNQFLNTVDRSSSAQKLQGLLGSCDYFLYEMFHNYGMALQDRFRLFFRGLKLKYFEIVNFMFILLHQILLIIYFFKEVTSDNPEGYNEEERFTRTTGNLILAIIQLVYNLIVILIWSRYYLPTVYQYHIMKNTNVKFSINDSEKSKRNLCFTDNFIKANDELLKQLNSGVSWYEKVTISIKDVVLENSQINCFAITTLLLIIYFITGNSICLVIPILLVANLFTLLNDLVYTIRIKWQSLGLVIIFSFIFMYFYTWIGFLYLYEIYDTSTTAVGQVT